MSAQTNYDASVLWEILTETVHVLPMYKYHRRYVERSILPEKPKISAKEMALLMGIPLGESIIILEELRPASKVEAELQAGPKPVGAKSLLDYAGT